MKAMKRTMILAKYFNGDDTTRRVTSREFLMELQALSADERDQLAQLAAKEMGVEIDNSL